MELKDVKPDHLYSTPDEIHLLDEVDFDTKVIRCYSGCRWNGAYLEKTLRGMEPMFFKKAPSDADFNAAPAWFNTPNANFLLNKENSLEWFLYNTRDSYVVKKTDYALLTQTHVALVRTEDETMKVLRVQPQPKLHKRHEVYEERAQNNERDGKLAYMALNTRAAIAALAIDKPWDAEKDAIENNRFVSKQALKEMSAGDRKCYEMKSLKEFQAMKSMTHREYFYW